MKLGRNELCHCGSARKYKRCCLEKDSKLKSEEFVKINKTNSKNAAIKTKKTQMYVKCPQFL